MVTIPLFGDQFLNAKNIQRRGLAVLIERNELNRDTLVAALREMLCPESTYARKAAKVARHLRGRAAAARAELSHWVKLVAEEGQMDHLMMRARDLSFVQYHCLDIIAYLLDMLLLALLCAVVSLVLPLNVLIWNPTVGHSHVRFLSNIADILINDGHNVTIVSPLVDPDVSVNGLHPAVLHLPYQSKYTRNIEDNDFAKLDIKGTSLWDVPPKEGRSTSVQDIALFMTTLKNVYRGMSNQLR
ncbi:hypothetical protein GCK32_017091 [Trichostrongylus colubriformis]|uniref:glucuronosyltransferase n=1 Tax=Trichostrongylus colubriformis TaxID=6319 RepID=A0AAN8FSP6_TRICO